MDIKDIAKLTKIKAHTLRYYENVGLIKDVERNSYGKRVYNEKDILWFEFLKRLKSTGMKIMEMKNYADLRYEGDKTISQRKNILVNHLETIEEQIKNLMETKEYVEKKIIIYEKMEEEKNGKGNKT